jgi:hypothetical protein
LSADEAGSQGLRVLAGYIFGKNNGAHDLMPRDVPGARASRATRNVDFGIDGA